MPSLIYVRTTIEMALEHRLDLLGEALTIFASILDVQSTAFINKVPAHSTRKRPCRYQLLIKPFSSGTSDSEAQLLTTTSHFNFSSIHNVPSSRAAAWQQYLVEYGLSERGRVSYRTRARG